MSKLFSFMKKYFEISVFEISTVYYDCSFVLHIFQIASAQDKNTFQVTNDLLSIFLPINGK